MSMDWIALGNKVKELVRDTTLPTREEVDDLLAEAAAGHLPLSKAHRLFSAALAKTPEGVGERVIEMSRKVRREVFGDQVVVMAPIEVSNVCASECLFCGWRVSNSDMRRIRQRSELVLHQVEYLLDLGIDYIELVGGDDFRYVREQVPELVPQIRKMMDARGIRGRICICSMAVTENHYRQWKELGADAMIVWQETYDPVLYSSQILSGPKARGINEDYRLGPVDSGFQFRLDSQERAMRAGLEVALGFMLGLSSSPHFEFLMMLEHVKHLLSLEEGRGRPIILGIPTWNKITTPATDLRKADLGIDLNAFFPIYAALLFLCLPKGRSWVFPSCRVSLESHLTAIDAAGPFTVTEVKIGPGGYLPRLIQARRSKGLPVDGLMEQVRSLASAKTDDLDEIQRQLDQSEQFMHYHHTHHQFVEHLRQRNLRVVPADQLAREAAAVP